MLKNELRRDPVTGNWLIILQQQPNLASILAEMQIGQLPPEEKSCDFCEGNEFKTPAEIAAVRPSGSLPNDPGWLVRVVPDKNPVLQIHGELNNRGIGLYDVMDGIGAHELIIDTPNHGVSFKDFTMEQFRHALSMYKERILDLKRDPRFRYILVHKSHGEAAIPEHGHSFAHVLATPITPFLVKAELIQAEAHYAMKERCLFCDIIDQELAMEHRLIFADDGYVAISPFASRTPFQVMILPRRHEPFFEWHTDLTSLAEFLHALWKQLVQVLGDFAYFFAVHSGPNIIAGKRKNYWRTLERDYHWHIEITPRLSYFNSLAISSGFQINPVSPELATSMLITPMFKTKAM